jgi:hypothetical protein
LLTVEPELVQQCIAVTDVRWIPTAMPRSTGFGLLILMILILTIFQMLWDSPCTASAKLSMWPQQTNVIHRSRKTLSTTNRPQLLLLPNACDFFQHRLPSQYRTGTQRFVTSLWLVTLSPGLWMPHCIMFFLKSFQLFEGKMCWIEPLFPWPKGPRSQNLTQAKGYFHLYHYWLSDTRCLKHPLDFLYSLSSSGIGTVNFSGW